MKQFNQLICIIMASLSFPSILTGSSYTLSLSDVLFDASLGTITDYVNSEEKDIIIPSSFIVDGVGIEVSGIGKSAFFDKSLTKVVIPSSVNSIGEDAFANNSLSEITIPSSVTFIGVNSFGRNSLVAIEILNGVNYIGDGAFTDNSLSEVILPSSVTYIGKYAFSINSIMNVEIPNSVINIGKGAFYGNLIGTITLPNHINLASYGWIDGCGRSYVAGDRVWDMQFSYSIPGAYSIAYKLDDGENSTLNPIAYHTVEGVAHFEEATKDGYAFIGWYSDKEFANEIATVATGETGNLTLWAKWCVSTGLEDDEKMKVNVYPNPTVDILNVDFNSYDNRTIVIYDVLGNMIYKKESKSNKETINMSTYSKGIYVVTIWEGDSAKEFKIFKE